MLATLALTAPAIYAFHGPVWMVAPAVLAAGYGRRPDPVRRVFTLSVTTVAAAAWLTFLVLGGPALRERWALQGAGSTLGWLILGLGGSVLLRVGDGFKDPFAVRDPSRVSARAIVLLGLVFGLVGCVGAFAITGDPLLAMEGLALPLFLGLGTAVGGPVGLRLGRAFGRLAVPALDQLGPMWRHLRAGARPLSLVLLGYPFLVVLFAVYYAAISRDDAGAFLSGGKPLHDPSFLGDFVYFSVVTIATVGYGDITPVSGLAKFVVSVEILVGIAWTTVVLAIVLNLMGPGSSATRPPEARP
jgi:hypothetical protein